jgi:uncharacterized protein YcnI
MRVVVALGLVLLLGARASAHVMVLPATSTAGGVERYTVVVPTEGNSATVRVELRVPLGVDIAALEAKPGWDASNQPFPIGAATVNWSGGRIPPDAMMSFDFLAQNPPAAHVLTWSATQWYEDGTSDRWGEGAPPDHQATTTTLIKTDGAGAVAATGGNAVRADVRGAERATPPSPDGGSSPALWIALVSLGLSVTALFVAVGGGRRRAGS